MAAGSAEHILAIDLGTSGPKVALVTTDGEIAGFEVETTGLQLTPDGGAEQDPADWWRAVSAAALRLLARRLVPPESICALSCTSQWMGTVPVDRDGNHLMNAVIWMDTRGGRYARRITSGFPRIGAYGAVKLWRWLRVTGGVPSRTGKDSLGHILYIQNEIPDVYRRTHKFLEPMDYLNLRFTGQMAASYDTITGHWLTDNRDLSNVRYVDKLVALSGIDREKLPDLRPTGSVLGPVTKEIAREFGLREDVQVVTGTPDTESAAVGSGAVRDFEPHLYIGTSSWLTCHVPFKRVDLANSLTSLPSGIPGKYMVATEQDIAGGCLTMLRDNVFCADDELSAASAGGGSPSPRLEAPEGTSLRGPPVGGDEGTSLREAGRSGDGVLETFNRMAERIPPGSGKLIFTPWLNGERTPVENHLVRGGFFNQGLGTTRAHMVRAVFEGVAYNTRWMHEHVERFVKRRLDDINFVGGGAGSDLWCQVHADVLDRTIRRVEQPRLANARGAALIAAVALGRLRFEDIPERTRFTAAYRPNPDNRGIYDELFGEFVNIYKNNKEMYARLNGRRQEKTP
ncbi:MAG: FGGY-family carbohydrate kinase [Dehalococcoidia bacterium]|nr:FGGY-family carbohydrate kinase [Dehalococcoidia bacterium]